MDIKQELKDNDYSQFASKVKAELETKFVNHEVIKNYQKEINKLSQTVDSLKNVIDNFGEK